MVMILIHHGDEMLAQLRSLGSQFKSSLTTCLNRFLGLLIIGYIAEEFFPSIFEPTVQY